MDRFQAMQVFTRVVDTGNFTRAADSLGLPRATVTTAVQNLERHLQVRLLNRTTRHIGLTPDGSAYYERCKLILQDVEEAESTLRDVALQPRGRLRVDTTPTIGRLVIIPALADFYRRYPDMEIALGMGIRPVDLVQEGVDCVIRIGELPDSSLVSRRLGTVHSITCASPEYLDRHGVPQTLDDLGSHQAVLYFSGAGRALDLSFKVDGAIRDIRMPGRILVNDVEAYIAAALHGHGLIQAPLCLAEPYLASGRLRIVLPQWLPPTLPVSALYLHNRHLSPKVRVFVDWAAELFGDCPGLRLIENGDEILVGR
ncbi:MAG TPA: LysR substrate-binding domain-containing protein, partial [Burkholderiaceae bacterium]|nr:LysR substrate-binding domain-containing protein [Burkholderiaceae bacterium]